jgi:hypothetical protein
VTPKGKTTSYKYGVIGNPKFGWVSEPFSGINKLDEIPEKRK